jgi:hypothetical protein
MSGYMPPTPDDGPREPDEPEGELFGGGGWTAVDVFGGLVVLVIVVTACVVVLSWAGVV